MSLVSVQMQYWLNDLRWLLLSEPLLNPQLAQYAHSTMALSSDEYKSITAWVDLLALNEQQLELFAQWMQSKPAKQILRLGRYAEHLLEFYLRHGPIHQLVAANLQVHVARTKAQATSATSSTVTVKNTIGEIDFLVINKTTSRREHWELAVKFFICPDVAPMQEAPSAQRLIGPDSVDSLAAKTTKLLDRQIKQLPPAPFDEYPWLGLAFTRGWIFYRRGRHVPIVNELNPLHGQGSWVEVSKLDELTRDDRSYVLLPRQRWLAPFQMQRGNEATLLNVEQLGQAIRELWASRAAGPKWPAGVLVSRMALLKAGDGSMSEVERIMVMPDTHSCM